MEQRHREYARAQAMFAVIEQYLASTLSQTIFCKQEGLAYSKFNYWLKQYRLREALAAKTATPEIKDALDHPPADFIPLRITPAEPVALSSACVIEFPSGVVVRFQGAVDASVLAQLIHTPQAQP